MPTGAPDYFKRNLLHGTDEDGNVIAALADADGRLIFILSDPTDEWGVNIQVSLGELISILTFAKRWDRRGKVLVLDGFDAGLGRVATATAGTGGAVAVDVDSWLYAAQSVKLTGGSDGNRTASVTYHLSPSVSTRLGIECSVQIAAQVQYIELRCFVYDGSRVHDYRMRLDNVSHVWEYYTTGAAWVSTGIAGKYQIVAELFRTWKMVVDPATDKYVRFIHQGGESDLSALSCFAYDTDLSARVYFSITVTSKSGQNGIVWVDGVIITHQEPE